MTHMKRFGFHALLVASFVLGLAACKQKDDPVPEVKFNNVKFEFSNIVGNAPLELTTGSVPGNKWYVNEKGDSFQVTMYKYYVSNVVLTKADGTTFKEQESYHLINQEIASTRSFTISNVPTGEYTSVSFLIGVDSARNTSGAQTGDLAVDKGMFWTWNSGYIMAKMEGFANTSTNPDKSFAWHTGGFKGNDNAIRDVVLNFPNKAIVSGSNIPNIHIFSNVLEWFKTPVTIGFADYTNVMSSGRQLQTIANNYANMFVVDHVDN